MKAVYCGRLQAAAHALTVDLRLIFPAGLTVVAAAVLGVLRALAQRVRTIAADVDPALRLGACVEPARRALRIQPTDALKEA